MTKHFKNKDAISKRDISKDIIFFILITLISLLYWFGLFMLISFMTLSVIPFTIEGIYILTIVGTGIIDIIYIIRTIKKYQI